MLLPLSLAAAGLASNAAKQVKKDNSKSVPKSARKVHKRPAKAFHGGKRKKVPASV